MDNNVIIYAAIAVLAGFVLIQKIRNRKAPASDIRKKIAEGAMIVDVRTPGEFSAGSYPKAKNIPLDALGERIGSLPRDKPIVLFCASGARSGEALRMLKQAGFTDVVSAGGLADMPR